MGKRPCSSLVYEFPPLVATTYSDLHSVNAALRLLPKSSSRKRDMPEIA